MGVRKGQGYGVAKPKRRHCPDCGKKGVTQWGITPFGTVRYCQFCQSSWGPVNWNVATAAALASPPQKEAP